MACQGVAVASSFAASVGRLGCLPLGHRALVVAFEASCPSCLRSWAARRNPYTDLDSFDDFGGTYYYSAALPAFCGAEALGNILAPTVLERFIRPRIARIGDQPERGSCWKTKGETWD